MEKESITGTKNTMLLATGTLTSFAFLQSLLKSKTLMLMTIIGLSIFAGFAFFLYKMASM